MHYLPCILLSRFGEGDGRDAVVWVWDKASGKTRRSTAEAEACQNDLYTLPRDAVEALKGDTRLIPRHKGPWAWEEMFQDIEGSLGPLLASITSTARMPAEGSDEMSELLHAIILMQARTPARLREVGLLNSMGMFPLSKTSLLTGERGMRGRVRPATIEWAAFHNTDALLDAERFVYSHSPTFPVMWPPSAQPVYRAVDDPARPAVKMTPDFFSRLASKGQLQTPTRFEVVNPH